MIKSTKLLGFLFALFLIFSQPVQAFTITESQINQYLNKADLMQDNIGIPGLLFVEYKLKDLHTQIGQTHEKRMEISGIAEGNFTFNGKKIPAKLNLSLDTIPYYDAEKGAVYLKDLRILRWSGEPNQYMEQMQTIMPFLSDSLAAIMSRIPVYQLDESKTRDVLIKKFAKEIRIEKGQLTLDAGIF